MTRGSDLDGPGLAPKRLVIGIMGQPPAVGGPGTGVHPGTSELKALLNVGMTASDPQGIQRPRLAEAVPTTENGLWNVFPDGRMETTWKIRSDANWHDGSPFTTDDLIFTSRVAQDPDLDAGLPHLGYRAIESIESPDARTMTVKWTRPFLQADTLFDAENTPMPKHLLEKAYLEAKPTFFSLAYWTEEFIGTGPFKMREWEPGSHLTVDANDHYLLGRPKVDQITVRFIPSGSTLIASVLAGAVELAMGRGLSFEQALDIQERWRDGRIAAGAGNPTVMFPKLLYPTPAVMADVQFRRAAVYGMDREAMTNALFTGLSAVAYGGFLLSEADRRDLEGSIARYDYDPRRAAQLIEEIGYRKGSDGLLRDAAGQGLALQLDTDNANDIKPKATLIIADYWQQLGVSVEPVVRSLEAAREPGWSARFLAVSVRRQPITIENLERYFNSQQIPLPENNYRGNNFSQYQSSAMDTRIGRFNATIPRTERMEIARQILHELTDQLVIVGLFYDVEVTLIGNRLRNVTGRNTSAGESWNAHEWDVS